MTKLPVISGKEVVKALTKIGFIHVRTAGSHAILKKEDVKGNIVVPVPLHKELAKGTLLSILHQVEITKDEFVEMFK